MGDIKATPRNRFLGLLADGLQGASDFASKPFGYDNPPVQAALGLLGVPAVASTLNELSYGGALGTGSGMTWKPKADTVDAAMTLIPGSAAAGNAVIKGGVAAAKKAAPAIERAVPRIMERGGLPAQLLSDMSQGTASYARQPKPFSYPQEQALLTAQKNAALPVEQGGLGLRPDNTPMERAQALGFEDGNVHFSRHGVDAQVLDSGQYAQAPFDAVGTHVGTPEAALDRFNNTVATTDQVKGSTYPLMVKKGDQFVSPDTGGAWREDALNAALFDRGGYATAREPFPSLNAKLRKDIFKGSGYDSIPYVNDVEGKGSISHIVPPWNLRSRFAAFDPMRIHENDLLGRASPGLLGLLAGGTGAGVAGYNWLTDR